MSVEAINWALRQDTDEPVDKLILIALANYAGDDHSSFPSRRKLSEIGMCSLDTVDRANRRLEARGLVAKETRLHPAGGKASNCYVLAVGGVAAPCGQGDGVSVDSRTMRGGQPHHAARVAAQQSGEGSRMGCGHKEPPKEPPKEIDPLPPKGGPTKLEALRAFEAYNATALRCGLPQASQMTPGRQKKIIARLREYGLDGWTQALANIEKSSFLTGGTDAGFRADLDFMVQAKSFGKLHDGGYGNGRHAKQAASVAAFAIPAKRPQTEAEMQRQIIDDMRREGLL